MDGTVAPGEKAGKNLESDSVKTVTEKYLRLMEEIICSL